MDVRLVLGDITEQDVDAVVNAANSGLMGGGGVDGAIHRRGGPEILTECRRIRQTTLPRGLPTGQAVATTAGKLPARHVIHVVGPVYGSGGPELLASCYREALRVADELGARHRRLPSGEHRGVRMAAGRRGQDRRRHRPRHPVRGAQVSFVLFSADAFEAFEQALAAVVSPRTVAPPRNPNAQA